MAKHTQGTWTAHKLKNGTYVIKEEGLFEAGYSDRIAELHEYPQNIEANAKLIAAAPELLKVCERLLKAFQHKDGDKKGNKTRTDIFKNCPEFRQIAVDARTIIDKSENKYTKI